MQLVEAKHLGCYSPGRLGAWGAARPATQRRGPKPAAASPRSARGIGTHASGASPPPAPRSCPIQAPPSPGTVQVAGICAFWSSPSIARAVARPLLFQAPPPTGWWFRRCRLYMALSISSREEGTSERGSLKSNGCHILITCS